MRTRNPSPSSGALRPHGRRYRRAATLCLILCVAAALSSLRAAENLPDLFDPESAAVPAAGGWLEYRVAFPVDPLENRLSPAPLSPPATGSASSGTDADGSGPLPPEPSFRPPAAWRVLPLRLEILEAGEEGVRARLLMNDVDNEVVLTARPPESRAAFRYEDGEGRRSQRRARVNGELIPVEVMERKGEGYGYVRWVSPDVPFGIVRFATENVDLALVAFGTGLPPEFPLPPPDAIDPPPGLYGDAP